jgi:hypothetical protein
MNFGHIDTALTTGYKSPLIERSQTNVAGKQAFKLCAAAIFIPASADHRGQAETVFSPLSPRLSL